MSQPTPPQSWIERHLAGARRRFDHVPGDQQPVVEWEVNQLERLRASPAQAQAGLLENLKRKLRQRYDHVASPSGVACIEGQLAAVDRWLTEVNQ